MYGATFAAELEPDGFVDWPLDGLVVGFADPPVDDPADGPVRRATPKDGPLSRRYV